MLLLMTDVSKTLYECVIASMGGENYVEVRPGGTFSVHAKPIN